MIASGECYCGHPLCRECYPTSDMDWCYQCGKYVESYRAHKDLSILCVHVKLKALSQSKILLEHTAAQIEKLEKDLKL